MASVAVFRPQSKALGEYFLTQLRFFRNSKYLELFVHNILHLKDIWTILVNE